MSVKVDFYYNKSENNRVDKDIELVGISQQDCFFKGSVSILKPVLLFRYSNDSSANKYLSCNYIKIGSPINRYYFVDEPIIPVNKMFEIHCHVDVLMTYKDEIRENTGIILRQENQWNLYLNDGTFKVYQNPIILTKEFPLGFTDKSFVLAVAGGVNSN